MRVARCLVVLTCELVRGYQVDALDVLVLIQYDFLVLGVLHMADTTIREVVPFYFKLIENFLRSEDGVFQEGVFQFQ